MGIYEELEWRGIDQGCQLAGFAGEIKQGGMTFYIGTDPTGDSFCISDISVSHQQAFKKTPGTNPILLVGGGTGLIGDPKPMPNGRWSPRKRSTTTTNV